MFLCGKYVILTLSQCCFYSCAGVAESPLCRANVLEHISLLRRYFYAGEIPAVSYPNSHGGKLQVISFQKGKRPTSARNRPQKAGKGKRPAQAAKTPAWGISGQVSVLECPASHIEQSRIELPLHKKGDKPSGPKPPAQIPYGSRYGSAVKPAQNHRQTKAPGNRMNTRFPGAFTGRSDVT